MLEIGIGNAPVGIVGDFLPDHVADAVDDPLEEVGVDRPFEKMPVLGHLRQVHHGQCPIPTAVLPRVRALDEFAHHGTRGIGARHFEIPHVLVTHCGQQPVAFGRERLRVGKHDLPPASGRRPEGQRGPVRDAGGADVEGHGPVAGVFGLRGRVHDSERGHVENVEQECAPARPLSGGRCAAFVGEDPVDPAQGTRVVGVDRRVDGNQKRSQRFPRRRVHHRHVADTAVLAAAEAVPVFAVSEPAGQDLPVHGKREDHGARSVRLFPGATQDPAFDRAGHRAVEGFVGAGDRVALLRKGQRRAAGAPERLPFACEVRRLRADRGRREQHEHRAKAQDHGGDGFQAAARCRCPRAVRSSQLVHVVPFSCPEREVSRIVFCLERRCLTNPRCSE
jgi:hypothetical protein